MSRLTDLAVSRARLLLLLCTWSPICWPKYSRLLWRLRDFVNVCFVNLWNIFLHLSQSILQWKLFSANVLSAPPPVAAARTRISSASQECAGNNSNIIINNNNNCVFTLVVEVFELDLHTSSPLAAVAALMCYFRWQRVRNCCWRGVNLSSSSSSSSFAQRIQVHSCMKRHHP